jgi:uncharacterized protein YdcH (DUF465 family)
MKPEDMMTLFDDLDSIAATIKPAEPAQEDEEFDLAKLFKLKLRTEDEIKNGFNSVTDW